MPDWSAALWQALQGIGMLGLVVVAIIAISRGAYVPRNAHQEIVSAQLAVIARLAADNERLQSHIERLESALAARGGDDD